MGLGGIVCAYHGMHWVGVELEERFIVLANRNFAIHASKWRTAGDPMPCIIHGDSRDFARLVGAVDAVVCSPPYAEGLGHDIAPRLDPKEDERRDKDGCKRRTYGTTPGQIGALKAGKVDCVITSPPYADSVKGEHGETETASESRDARQTPGGSLGQSQRHGGYGSKGNIGNLKAGKLDGVVTSPPYAEGMGHGGKPTGGSSGDTDVVLDAMQDGYGQTPGQIGALKAGKLDGVVTSPPWETFTSGSDVEFDEKRSGGPVAKDYGQTDGQIGNNKGPTYWEACRDVYEQVRLALKPGGVFVLVVKDYISKGKRVPLCDDTCTLLASIGFEPVERIRAMLVKETTEAGLFGDVTTTKERKSFFRRLAEKKGSPPIDWEEVIVVRAATEMSR